jgi:hypothetical protein
MNRNQVPYLIISQNFLLLNLFSEILCFSDLVAILFLPQKHQNTKNHKGL